MLNDIINFWSNWLGVSSFQFDFFDWSINTNGLVMLLSFLTIAFTLFLAFWFVYRLVSFIMGLCSRW